MKNKIRTYLPLINSSHWTGGTVFSNNLLYALKNYAPELEIINPPDIKSAKIPRFLHSRCPEIVKETVSRLYPFIQNKIIEYVKIFNAAPKNSFENQIEVIFSLGYYGGNAGTATLSWLPDFQHIHLPEMFSPQEISLRDKIWKETAMKTTLVVLSSHNAKEDFSTFIPEYSFKGRVMSFVANVPEDIYSHLPSDRLQKYSLPQKFIYLPNQFWKHKNHLLVLKALDILRKDNLKPHMICTGNETDYRNPGYFEHLKNTVRNFNLQDQVSFLGFVSHEDVFQLIRQSAFVLNPSLFEGWSTTVEETKSVGKRILLSGIGVHREQNPPSAVYFDPRNPDDLALKVKSFWKESLPGPDAKMEQRAKEMLPQRMEAFAEAFLSIAKEGIDMIKKRSIEGY